MKQKNHDKNVKNGENLKSPYPLEIPVGPTNISAQFVKLTSPQSEVRSFRYNQRVRNKANCRKYTFIGMCVILSCIEKKI